MSRGDPGRLVVAAVVSLILHVVAFGFDLGVAPVSVAVIPSEPVVHVRLVAPARPAREGPPQLRETPLVIESATPGREVALADAVEGAEILIEEPTPEGETAPQPTPALDDPEPPAAEEMPIEAIERILPPQEGRTGATGEPDLDAIHNPPPAYPELARRRGYEGTATVRVSVSAVGQVEGTELVASSGHPMLDRAALKALARWRFEPRRVLGVATATTLTIPVEFRLVETDR